MRGVRTRAGRVDPRRRATAGQGISLSELPILRLALAGAAAGILALLVYVLVAGADDYVVRAKFSNAGQLVPGNQVQIGGLRIGSVKSVELDENAQAEVALEIDRDYAPLHHNTTAIIRVPGLAGIAARYVALTPGPDNGPEIEDGGVLPLEDTQGPVEVDAVFSALDPRTLSSLQRMIQGSSEAFRGRGRAAMRAIEQLNPALSESSATLHEAARDQAAVEDLLSETADLTATLAGRQAELEAGTADTAAAMGAIAARRTELVEVLALTPPALAQANTTLANVRRLLEDVRPAIGEARPAARGLSKLLPRLRPLTADVRTELGDVRRLAAADLPALLDRLPAIDRAGRRPLSELTKALDSLSPVVSTLRAYTPDLIPGLAGVGGIAAGHYDANGEYARIEFMSGERTLIGPVSGLSNAFEKSAVERCPGASNTYPPADESAPFTDGGRVVCDPDLGIEQP